MRTWRDLTAFVLLAHLVTLSNGNIEGAGTFEKILAKNVSIVLIDNKESKIVDESVGNVTSLIPGRNNDSVVTKTAMIQDEKILEDKLEKALENAASLGEIILITPPENKINSTEKLPGSVIVIEAPKKRKSKIERPVSEAKIKKSVEFCESGNKIPDPKIRRRSVSKNYVNYDDLEDLEDLSAITEYEPQRIDTKTIERKVPPPIDSAKSETQSTIRKLPEERHYDVPKEEPTRNLQRIGNDKRSVITETELKESPSQLPVEILPSESQSIQSQRITTNPLESKTDKKKISTSSKFRQNPNKIYTELSRGPNSEIAIPLTTKSSNPRKLSYTSVDRKNNLLGESSSIDVTSTLIPGLSIKTEEQLRNIQNLTNNVKSPKKNDHFGRARSTPISLISSDELILENENSSNKIEPTVASSEIAQKNRRSDQYLALNYPKSSNQEHNKSPNEQLGYLTRYNLPSLVTGNFPKTRSFPPESRKLENSKEFNESEGNQALDIRPKETSPRNSRTIIPVQNSYEESERRNVDSPRRLNRIPQIIQVFDDKVPAANNHPVNGNVYHASRNLPSPIISSQENYGNFLKTNGVSQQQRFNEGQRRGVTINPYVVPIQPNYNSPNYPGKSVIPVSQNNIINTPVYRIHGANVNPTAVPTNVVYNPYKNFSDRKSLPTNSLESQKHNLVPRPSTGTLQILSTTSDYENSDEAKNPPPPVQRLRSSNLVDNRGIKPIFNAYNNQQKLESPAATSIKTLNSGNIYRDTINNPSYSVSPENRIRRLNPVGNIAQNNYIDNRKNNDNDKSLEKVYSPASTKVEPQKQSFYGVRLHNQGTRGNPDYESYEDNQQNDSIAPSTSAKSTEKISSNYGRRTNPKIVSKQKKIEDSSQAQIYSSQPINQSVKPFSSNYKARRPVSSHVDEEPVESVNLANVEEAATSEDEASPDSGHEEDHASYKIHENTKQGGGGGGDHHHHHHHHGRGDHKHKKGGGGGGGHHHHGGGDHKHKKGGGGGGGHHHHGGGDHKHEEGGGVHHEEDHHESHGEKGDKGYKGYHEYDKGEKGHHDKEDHDKEYDEKKGDEKKHEDESAYHKEHHHDEKGHKEAEFGEKGEHQKGHSTKGQHVVHKKDEYEKKTEFYDESHEEDGDENEGEFHHEHESEKGGHEKGGHHKLEHHEDEYGEKGEHAKGHHYHEKKGHDGSDEHKHHHHHDEKYGKKGGHEEGVMWSHKKGDDGHGDGKKKS